MRSSIYYSSSILALAALGSLFPVPTIGADSQSSEKGWIPYAAVINETSKIKDASGHETLTQKQIKQTQSADGSQLIIYLKDDRPIGGKLISGNGDVFSLDFNHKQAVPMGNHGSRGQAKVPKDPPLGTEVVAGLPCTLFPMQSRGESVGRNTGTVCVDTVDDIPLKIEIHTDNSSVHQDYLQQVVSITLYPPNAPPTQILPDGFVALKR